MVIFSESQEKRIRQIMYDSKLTKSDIIRLAMQQYLDSEEYKQKLNEAKIQGQLSLGQARQKIA